LVKGTIDNGKWIWQSLNGDNIGFSSIHLWHLCHIHRGSLSIANWISYYFCSKLVMQLLGIIIFIVIFAFGGTVKSVLDVVGKYISYFSGLACGAFLFAMLNIKQMIKV
jgi:hypothetical protein